MFRIVAAIVVTLLLPVSAQASCPNTTAPAPGWVQLPNCGWLPGNHPAAQPATTPTVVPPPAPVQVETLTGCDHLNPYTGRTSDECVIGTYRIGRVYAFGTVERGLVIGLAALPNGTEIVTVAFLDSLGSHRGGPDHVWSFKNDGSYRPWRLTAANGY